MEMEGKIWKDGKIWLVEIPALDAMTQGKTRKEALAMTEDLVVGMARSYFKDEIDKDFSLIRSFIKVLILDMSRPRFFAFSSSRSNKRR